MSHLGRCVSIYEDCIVTNSTRHLREGKFVGEVVPNNLSQELLAGLVGGIAWKHFSPSTY